MRRSAETLVLLTSMVLGCGRHGGPGPADGPGPATTTATPAESAKATQEKLAQLRALGYLSTSGLPQLGAGKGVEILDRALAFPGYTLVVFAGSCECQLLSLEGEVVRSWKDAPCHRWEHAELLPGGDLVVVGARFDESEVEDPIDSGRYLMRLSWNGEVVWKSEMNAHHDVSLTPDGRLLTLVLNRRRIPAVDPDNDVADDELTLVTQDGEVVESFSVFDVLAAGAFPFQKAGGRSGGGRKLIDLLHCNAARWNGFPDLASRGPLSGRDSVLVTSRHQDEVFVIDWKRRELVWHWGRGVVSGPHEASLTSDGNVLLFDNGLVHESSRVIEVDPASPGTLRQFSPGSSRFFDRVMGSCQRLPNGNTLIVHSEGGSAFELSTEGRPAWSYAGTKQTPDGHRVKLIRMRRLPSEMIEKILMRRGAGLAGREKKPR
jgi:hypothetical protein